jgi:hypothetical protein
MAAVFRNRNAISVTAFIGAKGFEFQSAFSGGIGCLSNKTWIRIGLHISKNLALVIRTRSFLPGVLSALTGFRAPGSFSVEKVRQF